MDEQPAIAAQKDEKHSIHWGALILWPVVILILYVLSVGPITMILFKRGIAPKCEFMLTIYAPLGWAYKNTSLHKPLGMYLHLWAPHYYDKNGDNKFSK